jgi:dihydroneopterin aldolase
VKVGIPTDNEIVALDHSVNYEGLLQVVKNDFLQTRPLLEQLVQSIAAAIKATYPQIKYVWVSAQKNNPPLGYDIESSEVSVEQYYL